jgi:peptidyl-prolyl cis-trans isomerase B (cyclophilin B)
MTFRNQVVTLGVVVVAVLLGACGGPKLSPAAGRAIPTGGGACAYQTAPATANVQDVGIPPANPRNTGTATMRIETGGGAITVRLYTDKAPCAVGSFAYLAGKGFFDNTACHRLTTQGIFVLQCGDPSGTGAGGPTYAYAEENVNQPYKRGVVAVANTGQPNSSSSQFFINYKDNALPPAYTVFGEVTGGLDVVDKVAAGGDDGSNGAGDGHPNIETKLSRVTVDYD